MRRGEYGTFFLRKIRRCEPLVRPKRKWEDNIKIEVKDIECGSGERINLA